MKIMHKTDRCQNTRRHVGVRLCFRDVYFLRGSFRRDKVPIFPRDRPTCLRWVSLRLIRLQITERFRPISLDFGFAYGDRSFSRKAVNNNNNNKNYNNNYNNYNNNIFNQGKPVSWSCYKWMPWATEKLTIKGKITITEQLSEKCKTMYNVDG